MRDPVDESIAGILIFLPPLHLLSNDRFLDSLRFVVRLFRVCASMEEVEKVASLPFAWGTQFGHVAG